MYTEKGALITDQHPASLSELGRSVMSRGKDGS